MPILELKGLTKRFGGLVAVNKVDLSVEEGEIFAMIGPNGAGKTTVFNLVAGLYKPTSGQILFNGRSVYPVREFWRTYLPPLAAYYTVADAVRRGLGLGPMPLGLKPHAVTTLGVARTFQNIRLFSYMTALENVMVGEHARMHAQVWDALLHTPFARREERRVRDRAMELLRFVGLERLIDVSDDIARGPERNDRVVRSCLSGPPVQGRDEG